MSEEELRRELERLRARVTELEYKEREFAAARETLIQGLRAFAVVLEHTPEVNILAGADGTIKSVSPSVRRIAGYREEELVGRRAISYIHEEDRVRALEYFSRTLSQEEPGPREEFRYRHADGSWHVLDIVCVNLLDNPAVGGVLMIARDVTDRKETEDALRRSELYFRSLIRNAADMITILDGDLTFRWGSRATALITGHGEETYGRSILDYIHPDDVEDSRRDFEVILATPGVPYHCVRRFRHADGTYHHHHAILTNLLHEPSVRGIIINSRDVTERVVMEERLRASVRELDAFATTVSHDLRTPLSLIQGYAQLLRAGDVSEEEREMYLDNIITAARRMDELTASLLEYAQAGRPAGEVSPVDPRLVLEEVLFENAEALGERGAEVAVEDALPTIMVDPLKLRQVFANLVENALKYAAIHRGLRIEVGAMSHGNTATLFVRDNGDGIDPRLREEIFQPFRRSAKAGSAGLGIGLSTVKRAVEGWGGKIWVESEPGKGAAFYFTAPLAEAGPR
ncbi:MAG: PAS domain S-box protein [Actinobacteria bacterium]|nr:PAS domain S-box protein [Actinomycetota bacterium]